MQVPKVHVFLQLCDAGVEPQRWCVTLKCEVKSEEGGKYERGVNTLLEVNRSKQTYVGYSAVKTFPNRGDQCHWHS